MTEARQYEALRRIGQQWNEERVERLLAATHGRIRRAQKVRVVSVAAVLTLGIFVLFFTRPAGFHKPDIARTEEKPAASPTAPAETRLVKLSDGSSVQLLNAQSRVQVIDESNAKVSIEVRQGGGRFSIVPQQARPFVVRAGAISVKVVGTEFIVQLREARTWVQVIHGRVQVNWPGGEQSLGAGEQGLFPVAEAIEDAAVPVRAALESKAVSDGFHARAQRRDYAEAFALMQANPAVVGRSVDDLMLAADVARLSGHPAQAVPFLDRVLREHEKDDRAALAAFTLGRTLLGLGRAQEALRAFARVSVLAPASALAEDALARQVEAAARVGDRDAARNFAQQYLRKYPHGRRAAAVREQTGIQ